MSIVFRAVLLLMVVAPPAIADITWNWSFGDEAGTFMTEGEPSDLDAAGLFRVVQFDVVQSVDAANTVASYSGPADPFIVWEPTAVVRFQSGTGIPFGSSIQYLSETVRYTFLADSSGTLTGALRVLDDEAASPAMPLTIQAITSTVAPAVHPVPTLSTAGMTMLMLSMLVLGGWMINRGH